MSRLFVSTVLMLAAVSAAQAQDSVELHSVIIENGNVRVEYSKNFVTCAHLYREATHSITHIQNLFCESGEHVVSINSLDDFRRLMVGEVVYLKHGNASTRSATVTVTNRPVADAGADQVIPCPAGAIVQLDGTGSYDPNGDGFSLLWTVPSTVLLDDPTSATPLGAFPVGVTMATLTVTDDHGAVDTDDVVITVYDDAPPEVACTTNVASLAPPNRKMVAVEVYVEATDVCDAPDQLQLVAVTLESNEPDDADGKSDGSTTGDTHGADGFSAPVDVTSEFLYNAATASFEGTVFLRAELDKNGSGRTYSINATVVDTAGNLADTSCVVVVPKKGRRGKGPKK